MPPAIRVDAHQHFWKYNTREYAWIGDEMERLRRNFLPEDLDRELAAAKMGGTVAIQARQSLEETGWLLSLADKHETILGVVGWIDLCGDNVGSALGSFASHPRARGVRHVLQEEPDDHFMLRDEFLHGIAALHEHNLTYDLLIYPRHLPVARELTAMFPEQKFVLDHVAKPPIRSGSRSPWESQLHELARLPNVFCKLSGLVTEADWRSWNKSDIRPYLEIAYQAFGEDRLMFGSDWPVCTLAASYSAVAELIGDFVSTLPSDAAQKIMGLNAVRFYGLRMGNE